MANRCYYMTHCILWVLFSVAGYAAGRPGLAILWYILNSIARWDFHTGPAWVNSVTHFLIDRGAIVGFLLVQFFYFIKLWNAIFLAKEDTKSKAY